jgi:uncharacterized protein (TIGR02001 family)
MDRISSRRPARIAWHMRQTALATALLVAPTAVLSQTAEDLPATRGVEISGSVALVSDYRFRGISQTDIAPAIQPSLQLDLAQGLFLGFWGSNIADLNGATTEIDLSAGWAGRVAGLDVSAGLLGYLYPGGTGTDVVEFFGSVGMPIGPLFAGFGLNWAPQQANSGASRYAFAQLSAAIPGKPITLRASLGHERGGFVSDETERTTAKWDWLLGVDFTVSALTVGIAYVGTDLPSKDALGNRANRIGGDGLLLTLSAAF